MSSHGQVAVVTAFLCQFNQVSEPGGNCRPTWEEYLRGIQIGHETNGTSGDQLLKFKTQRHSDCDEWEVNTTCHSMKVLLNCNCSRQGGEDCQHPQHQTDIGAAQGTFTQHLQRWNQKKHTYENHCPQILILSQHKTILQCNFAQPNLYLSVLSGPKVRCFFSQEL